MTAPRPFGFSSTTPPRGPNRYRPLYVEQESEDLHAHLRTAVDAPLNALGEKELCPGQAALDKFSASLR